MILPSKDILVSKKARTSLAFLLTFFSSCYTTQKQVVKINTRNITWIGAVQLLIFTKYK